MHGPSLLCVLTMSRSFCRLECACLYGWIGSQSKHTAQCHGVCGVPAPIFFIHKTLPVLSVSRAGARGRSKIYHLCASGSKHPIHQNALRPSQMIWDSKIVVHRRCGAALLLNLTEPVNHAEQLHTAPGIDGVRISQRCLTHRDGPGKGPNS